MNNFVFGWIVVLEVTLSMLAAAALYIVWWPNVQSTADGIVAGELSCVDYGQVPHYALEEVVRSLVRCRFALLIVLKKA